MLWMTLLVFVSVAAFSIGAAVLAGNWRGRAVDRLERPQAGDGGRCHRRAWPGMSW